MKTKKVTLKGFVNIIDIKPQIEAIKKQYPDYKEKPIVSELSVCDSSCI